jgi:hypothetical protein
MGYLMGLPVNAIVFGWTLALRAVAGKAGSGASRLADAFNVVVFCCQFLSLIHT